MFEHYVTHEYCQVFFIILEKRGIRLEEGDFSVFLVSKTS